MIVGLADVGMTLYEKFVIYDQIATITGYVKRGEALLYPESSAQLQAEPEKASVILKLRTLLDDSCTDIDQGMKGYFTGANIRLDSAVIIADQNGESARSSGIWAAVCKGADAAPDPLKATIGLLSVNELCAQTGAEQLYDILQSDPEAEIRLTVYGSNGYAIIPGTIEVRNQTGTSLGTIVLQEIPDGYQRIEAKDVYIYNTYSGNEFNWTDESLAAQMSLVYRGERKVDKLAAQAQNALTTGTVQGRQRTDSNGNTVIEKVLPGFGTLTVRRVAMTQQYTMVVVEELSYLGSVVLYAGLVTVIWTILYGTICIVRSRKNTADQDRKSED